MTPYKLILCLFLAAALRAQPLIDSTCLMAQDGALRSSLTPNDPAVGLIVHGCCTVLVPSDIKLQATITLMGIDFWVEIPVPFAVSPWGDWSFIPPPFPGALLIEGAYPWGGQWITTRPVQ